jgi:hypothetical protein
MYFLSENWVQQDFIFKLKSSKILLIFFKACFVQNLPNLVDKTAAHLKGTSAWDGFFVQVYHPGIKDFWSGLPNSQPMP